MKYYHGGVQNLDKGDNILPPSITGKSTLLQYAKQIDPNGVQLENKVYITTDKVAAMIYASSLPFGDVYEVEPVGELEHDPDCTRPGLSFQCDSATVKKVIFRRVPLP